MIKIEIDNFKKSGGKGFLQNKSLLYLACVAQRRKFDFLYSEYWQFEKMFAGQQKHDVMHAFY